MTETLQLRGTLEGHAGWVTQIATNPKYPDIILSASRDKALIATTKALTFGLESMVRRIRSEDLKNVLQTKPLIFWFRIIIQVRTGS